jgi:hypothetical protein
MILAEANHRTVKPNPTNSFRHFIRTPGPDERFRLFGQRPQDIPERINNLFFRLSERFIFANNWETPLRSGFEAWENPDIPAGYTYLAQLVAHDLVQTSLIFPTIHGHPDSLRNNRSFKLDLDTLYGSGPAGCPHAYSNLKKFGFRSRLRLSRMRQSSTRIAAANPPFRDIGRGCAVDDNSYPMEGATEPLLADPRNDDNANLSQLLTIFVWLHNTVLERIEAAPPIDQSRPAEITGEFQFSAARRIVTDIYRRIVRHDLVPRIIDHRVLSHYDTQRNPFVDQVNDGRMPLEFSHAAYRFGHAMIRPSYKLNDVHDPFDIEQIMRTTSRRKPQAMPLNERWIIEWSRFFNLGDTDIVNFSQRIGPKFAGSLELPALFDYANDGAPRSLGHRDLLRSGATNLWSVPALIEEIKKRQPQLIALSRTLSDFSITKDRIRDWLQKHRGYGDMQITNEEIQALSDEPPLLFFILFEAADEAEGRHLGVLGSVVVAETLLKQFIPEDDAALEGLTHHVFGTGDIRTMPTLLNVLAKQTTLQNAEPPFL